MTPRQRITLQADWWPAACRTQGWRVNDRDLRLRVCAWAVSLDNPTQAELLDAIAGDQPPRRNLKTTNDLNNRDDVDRVKACLGMLADNLKATREVGQPQFGSARRKRDLIRSHLKCLALFQQHPKRYLAKLIADMFDGGASYAPGQPATTIKDLTDDEQIYLDRKTGKTHEGPSQLERLVMRLAQVVNDARNANQLVPAYAHLQGSEPLTLHEMKWTAGVYCDCKYCCGLRAQGKGPILPPLPKVENWGDFDPELEPATAADCELGDGNGGDNSNPF